MIIRRIFADWSSRSQPPELKCSQQRSSGRNTVRSVHVHPKYKLSFNKRVQAHLNCRPPSKKTHRFSFQTCAGASRNKLAQCTAPGTGSRLRRENKTSGRLSKQKFPYLERWFSTGPKSWGSSDNHFRQGWRKTRPNHHSWRVTSFWEGSYKKKTWKRFQKQEMWMGGHWNYSN